MRGRVGLRERMGSAAWGLGAGQPCANAWICQPGLACHRMRDPNLGLPAERRAQAVAHRGRRWN